VEEEEDVVDIPVRFFLTALVRTMLTFSRLAKSSKTTGAFPRQSTSRRISSMIRTSVLPLAL
jgi:hypothetical protein